MKKMAIALALITITGLTATAVFAQGNFTMRANVPFAFSIDGRTYDAGTYTLQAKNSNGVVLHNQKTGQSVIVPLLSQNRARYADAHLNFSASGTRATLHNITDAEGHTWKVPVSRKVMDFESKTGSELKMVAVALK